MKGNTEGSLSEVQKAIIVGSLLGDGYMRCKTNAHLEINHAYSQKEYVDWKYKQLKDLVLTPPVKRKGNGQRVAYRFATRSLPVITKYYQRFYQNGKKVIPEELELKRISLAVWFMDDGSRCGNQLYFNTQRFSREEQNRLIQLLRNQWGVDSSLNKDKEYYRIRILCRSTKTLIALVKSYTLSIFAYKLLI